MSVRRSPVILAMLMSLLLLALAGCATVKPLGVENPLPEAEGRTLLRVWLEQNEGHRSLQGLAKVKVKTDQDSVSGTQVVIVARPDRLRAETLSPFGTPLLSLASDGRRLAVLLPAENLYYSGAATTENLTRFTGMPLAPKLLVDILLWQPPLVAYRELSAFRGGEGEGWRLLLETDSLRQELQFDAAMRLRQARYFSAGALQLSVEYAGFAGDTPFPRQIRLEQPPSTLRVSLDFSELTVNPTLPVERFQLAPPPGSRVFPLDSSGDFAAPSGLIGKGN